METHLLVPVGVLLEASKAEKASLPEPGFLLKTLRAYGLVILRGYNVGEKGFYALTDRISPGVHRGVVKMKNALELHGELYYTPWPPDILWFHCVVPSEVGGQTIFCDGVKVAESLSNESKRFFALHTLNYQFSLGWEQLCKGFLVPKWAAGWWIRACGSDVSMRSDGKFQIIYRRSAIRRTRWGHKQAFVNTLLHALDPLMSKNQPYKFITSVPDSVLRDVRLTTEKLTLEIEWEKQDIIIVDNSRVMHGRRAFEGERSIIAVNGVISPLRRYLRPLLTRLHKH